MYLTETHRIYKDNPYYTMLDDYCYKAKNLYNNGMYHIRQYYLYYKALQDNKFTDNLNLPNYLLDYMKDKGSYIDYYKLDYLSKQLNNSLTEDYKSLPISSSAQGVLKQLNQNWQSFFKSIKDFVKHPEKYKGKPKLPKYLDKNGRYLLVLTNQNCKLKDGFITFPKSFDGLNLKTKVDNIKQVRIIPKGNYYQIEVIFEKLDKPLKEDNNKYLSVDIGVNNLAAITNNFNGNQYLISGKPLKLVNQYYNKLLASYKSKAKLYNGLDMTKRIQSLTKNRNNFMKTYMHKASKLLIDLAISYDVSKIVIGYNKDWKQEVNIGKQNNQTFVSIPFLTFVNYISYKAKLNGIEVIKTEESYTSGTSYLDRELPIKENYNKNRRIHRGLFKSNSGIFLNSDVNGSYQILKKVIGDYFVKPTSLKVLQVT